MAKVKTFAVTVEWTVRRTVFVEARRPGGAEEKALSHDGWTEANRYADDDECVPLFLPKDATVVDIRVANL